MDKAQGCKSYFERIELNWKSLKLLVWISKVLKSSLLRKKYVLNYNSFIWQKKFKSQI